MKQWKNSVLSVIALGTAAFGQGTDPNVLCPSEVAEGFKLLFDGTSAVSFRNNFVDYESGRETNTNLDAGWQYDAVNKAIKSGGNEPDTRSKEKITTTTGYDIRFSYRNPSNQGVIYMMTVAGGASWGTGVEFGIDNRTDECKVCPGAAYDIFAPKPNTYFLFNTNKWNDARIVNKGQDVEHWMNGKLVVKYKYHDDAFWTAYNASKWNSGNELTNKVRGNRGALNDGYITEGYWGWQADHGGAWLLRSLRISTTNVAVGPAKGLATDWSQTNTGATNWPGRGCVGVSTQPADPDKYSLKRMEPMIHRNPGQIVVEFAGLPLREASLRPIRFSRMRLLKSISDL